MAPIAADAGESSYSTRELFSVLSEYQTLYDLRSDIVETIDANDVENLLDSEQRREQYFRIGDDALRIVVGALIASGRRPPATILDFPSGSGRVTRHLRAMFSSARIVVADLYASHVDFCVSAFGVEGVVTPTNVNNFSFGVAFDLIFCGSLLTHLPRRQAIAILDLIGRSLSADGIAVITLHGRRSDYVQKHGIKFVPDRRYRRAKLAAQVTGFGYVEYPSEFRLLHFFKQRRYGIALVRPWWVARRILNLKKVRLVGYSEMDWDRHHDVVVISRR